MIKTLFYRELNKRFEFLFRAFIDERDSWLCSVHTGHPEGTERTRCRLRDKPFTLSTVQVLPEAVYSMNSLQECLLQSQTTQPNCGTLGPWKLLSNLHCNFMNGC